jgi:transposase-like protein
MIKEHSANRSIHSIARDLNRPYNTVYYSIKKLKESTLAKKLTSGLSREVEIDETYITVGEKGNRNLTRKPRTRGGTKKKGRGSLEEGKVPVIVITERGGDTMFFVALDGLSKDLVLMLLNEYVEKGSAVNTDDFSIYTGIEESGYVHRVLPRYNGKKKFAEGDVHINNAENRFSFLKTWYRIFRGISRSCITLWVNFFEFLLNLKMDLIHKTLKVIENICILNT